jgi:hypothetical protein
MLMLAEGAIRVYRKLTMIVGIKASGERIEITVIDRPLEAPIGAGLWALL